jgi:hypothetical protein
MKKLISLIILVAIFSSVYAQDAIEVTPENDFMLLKVELAAAGLITDPFLRLSRVILFRQPGSRYWARELQCKLTCFRRQAVAASSGAI